MKEKYQVIISIDKDTSIPTGRITGTNNTILFNPLYVLTELRYKSDKIALDDFCFDDWDYSEEHAFDSVLQIEDKERRQYVAVVHGIKKLILQSYTTQTNVTLSDVELLRSYFDITFQFTPIAIVKCPKSLLKQERDLHPRFVHYSSFSMNTVLEKGISLYKEYYYQCYTPADILFSIMHFLAINEYKFNKCVHCNRFFATKSYKLQYCARLSEYPSYTTYTCYEAVKRIRQNIKRKYRQIYANLYSNYLHERLIAFTQEYDTCLKELIEHSDYNTIDKCYQTLDKQKWYTHSSKKAKKKRT